MREFISSAAKNALPNGPLRLLQRTNLSTFSNPRYKRILSSKLTVGFGSTFFFSTSCTEVPGAIV
jgi:hypothetical protein